MSIKKLLIWVIVVAITTALFVCTVIPDGLETSKLKAPRTPKPFPKDLLAKMQKDPFSSKFDMIIYTHNNLFERHLNNSFRSLQRQTLAQPFIISKLFLYHASTQMNHSRVEELIRTFLCEESLCLFQELINMTRNERMSATLGADLKQIHSQYVAHHNKSDKGRTVLLLKSDYSLNCLAFEVFKNITAIYKGSQFQYSLPILCAKIKTTDEDILRVLKEIEFPIVNKETYYRGTDLFPPEHEFGLYGEVKEFHPNIKFVSWGGSLDYNVHFMSSEVLVHLTKGSEADWGGLRMALERMRNLGVPFVNCKDAFAVHTFHMVGSGKSLTNNRGEERKSHEGHQYK